MIFLHLVNPFHAAALLTSLYYIPTLEFYRLYCFWLASIAYQIWNIFTYALLYHCLHVLQVDSKWRGPTYGLISLFPL